MLEKRLIGIGLIIFLAAFFAWSDVAVASPNVSDCLEGKKECTEADQQESGNAGDEERVAGASTGSLIFNLVKMAFALLLVLGLIYLLLKFLNKRNKLFQQVKALENLGGISVGPNKSVQLVRIGTKVYLIGVGENVEMLQEIEDEELKNDILHNGGTESVEPKAMLNSFFQQKQTSGTQSKSGTDFKKMFSSELTKLKQSREKLINRQKEDKDE
ncbi:flagellar biosynthetic protein FliO [Virgibacillus kekensis]|uniref:Flagellar biosynthetic protein FliO n=1 Tax=Virgibacillus kekensis TaxID=202261 RepID=A0ABV9DGZ0_9BACI